MNNNTRNQLKDQSGQTIVEFVLLLGVIVIISFTFLSLTNGQIIERWENMTKVIVDDPSQNIAIQ